MNHNYTIQRIPGRKGRASYWMFEPQQQQGESFPTPKRQAKFVDEESAKNFKEFLDRVAQLPVPMTGPGE